jgi:ABC-type dipeptide/oligopeptide/nickel transport system ATPase component
MAEGSTDILLKVENLRAFHTSKSGLIRAVNGVSFEVKKGESVGIFGESGAGKSSIAISILGVFNKLSRFYSTSSASEESERLWALHDQAKKKGLTPEEMGEDLPGVWGRVLYKGKDLLSLKEKELRKVRGNEITYVPQGLAGSLNPYTEIDLQTAEALWAHDDDDILWEREVARRVLEVLDLVEIGDVDIRKTLKPGEFSLGEDQRILIAMALIMEPSLMIADEPTTAVDVGVQQRILDAIILAKERLGLSILMISNDQGVIAETADQVGVMSAGKLQFVRKDSGFAGFQEILRTWQTHPPPVLSIHAANTRRISVGKSFQTIVRWRRVTGSFVTDMRSFQSLSFRSEN